MPFIVFQDIRLPAYLSPEVVRTAFERAVSEKGLEYRCTEWRGHYELTGIRRRRLGPFAHSSTVVRASVQSGDRVSLISLEGSPEDETLFTERLKEYLKESINGKQSLQSSPQ